jgi:hypothetical protein
MLNNSDFLTNLKCVYKNQYQNIFHWNNPKLGQNFINIRFKS